MTRLRRFSQALFRELAQALAGMALLVGWSVALGFVAFECAERRVPSASTLAVLNAALAAASALALGAVARRHRGAARCVTLTLLTSLVALPALHSASLAWLSEVRVGGVGHFELRLGPTYFYPLVRDRFPRSFADLIARIAIPSLLFARCGMALLERPRARAVLTAVSLGAVALLLGAALHATVTRPLPSRWLEAFPVLARVPVRDVRERSEGGATQLPAQVTLVRDAHESRDDLAVVSASAPALPDRRGGTHPQDPFPLECPLAETLVLRSMPGEDLLLLSCGEAPPSRWEGGGERSVVDVHCWWFKLRNLHLVGRVAPDPAWTATAALGLLLAGAIVVARKRPSRRDEPTHPYRSVAAEGGDAAERARLEALVACAVAVAVAVHAAAPLVLSAWLRLLLALG